jgi:hypothetical protein
MSAFCDTCSFCAVRSRGSQSQSVADHSRRLFQLRRGLGAWPHVEPCTVGRLHTPTRVPAPLRGIGIEAEARDIALGMFGDRSLKGRRRMLRRLQGRADKVSPENHMEESQTNLPLPCQRIECCSIHGKPSVLFSCRFRSAAFCVLCFKRDVHSISDSALSLKPESRVALSLRKTTLYAAAMSTCESKVLQAFLLT